MLDSQVKKETFSEKAFLLNKENSPICNEVDWILKNVPRKIAERIPVTILVSLINRKAISYNKTLELKHKNTFYDETILLVRYLIEKYVPEKLLLDVQQSVPADFDLSIIFDNPDYKD